MTEDKKDWEGKGAKEQVKRDERESKVAREKLERENRGWGEGGGEGGGEKVIKKTNKRIRIGNYKKKRMGSKNVIYIYIYIIKINAKSVLNK